MRVINIKPHRPTKCTHYIGRNAAYYGLQDYDTGLGNPFPLAWNRTRAQSIVEFEAWARATPHVLETIRRLPADAILGCWCKPKACHGDVIIKLWHELNPGNS